MFNYFYTLSDTYIFVFVAIFLIIISVISVVLIKRMVPEEVRYKNNAVIGSIGSFISIIFGVLSGLMALYLINNINFTADAVQNEANAVANIYRDSKWLKNPMRENIHSDIRQYLQGIINVEWPRMSQGVPPMNETNEMIIDDMSKQLSIYPITTRAELLVLREMFEDIKTLYNARQQRIHMSFAVLNPEIWVVIWIGIVLTLAMNFLFGMNFYLHLFSISAAALMATSIIFLLITLDKPFQGDFVISPDSFTAILNRMDTLDLQRGSLSKNEMPTKKSDKITIEDEIATQ